MEIKKVNYPALEEIKRIDIQEEADASPGGLAGVQDAIDQVKSAAEESPLLQEFAAQDSRTSQVAGSSRLADALTAIELQDLAANIGRLLDKIDLSKLENLTEAVKALGPILQDGALEHLIGSSVGEHAKGATTVIGAAKGAAEAGARDRARELMGPEHGGFAGSRSSFVSQDQTEGQENTDSQVEPPSLKEIVINFILGYATKQSPVPLPPTPPDPETGKNLWDGVGFFQDVLGISGGGGYENYLRKKGGVDTSGEPTPDGESSGGPRFITREMLKGIAARLGQLGEPNPESQAGSGGPIDETKASGNVGTAGEPVQDAQMDRAVVTDRDIDAIRIRLESKFRQS